MINSNMQPWFRFRYVLILMLWLSVIPDAFAQQVNVSTTLRPPYSSLIDDYRRLENKAVIILTNSSAQNVQVRLAGSISNDTRGLFIKTKPDFRPSMPISLPPFGTTTITANPDAMRFLDVGNVDTNVDDALQQTITRTGQLPEGIYRICVEVFDYNSNQLLSIPDMGCFNFSLTQADPPVITFPIAGQVLPPEIQTIAFNWTPPIGNTAGAIIEYSKVVVKVEPGQNPNDAIRAARDFGAGNPVILKQALTTNSYVRQPADLPFEAGATYAVQVIASDRNRKLLLRNDGASEVIVFQMGTLADRGIADNQPKTGPKPDLFPDVGVPPVYQTQNVTGKIHYYWEGTSAQDGGIVQQNTPQAKSNSPLGGVNISLVLAYQLQNPFGVASELLPGLIIPYHLLDRLEVNNSSAVGPFVIANTMTGVDGSYSFNVPDLSSIDFDWQQGYMRIMPKQIGVKGPGQSMPVFDSGFTYNGMFRRVLMVRVSSSPYYAQPIQFTVGSDDAVDMGTSYSRVKTMNLDVRVKDKYTDLNRVGVEVLLLRKAGTRPSSVPKDEMQPGSFDANPMITVQGQSYEVVAKDDTDPNGIAKFESVVFSAIWSPTEYFLHAQLDPFNTDLSLQPVNPRNFVYAFYGGYNPQNPPLNAFLDMQHSDWYSISGGGIYNENGYKVPQEFHQVIEVMNKPPRVYSTVRNTAAGIANSDLLRAEPGVSWRFLSVNEDLKDYLIASWGQNWGQAFAGYLSNSETRAMAMLALTSYGGLSEWVTKTTGEDGRIDHQFHINPIQPFYYFIEVWKAGFNTPIVVPVNRETANQQANDGDMVVLSPGRAYRVPDIEITPSGSLFVRLYNEMGDPVSGSAYYTDLNTGQNGVINNSQWYPEYSGEYSQVVQLNVPTGPIHLVVRPTNTDLYMADTLSMNIPEGVQHLANVTLPYKLHRIHFRVTNDRNQAISGARIQMMNTGAEMFDDIISPFINMQQGIPGDRVFRQIDILQTLQSDQLQLPSLGDKNKNAYQMFTAPKYLPENVQDLADGVNPHLKITNSGGRADFAFKNSGDSFDFRIYGPDGSTYVTRRLEVSSVPSRTWQQVHIILDEGRIVTGNVSIDEAPVDGARVRYSYHGLVNETFSDASGNYTLSGVPNDTLLTFTASKAGFIGMTYREGLQNNQLPLGIIQNINIIDGLTQVQQSNSYGQVVAQYAPIQMQTQVTTIDFVLNVYGDLDFTYLLGFPLEVTEFEDLDPRTGNNRGNLPGQQQQQQPRQEQYDGPLARISGLLDIQDQTKQVIKVNVTGSANPDQQIKTVEFHNKQVSADITLNDVGIAYAKPHTLPMLLSQNQLDVGIYSNPSPENPFVYYASMYNASGLVLDHFEESNRDESNEGALKGKVSILLSSFNDNNFSLFDFDLDDGQTIHVSTDLTGSSTNLIMPVFKSSQGEIIDPGDGLKIVNQLGEALTYQLHGFAAKSKPLQSRARRESFSLNTEIATNLKYVETPNLNLVIGDLVLDMATRLISPLDVETNFEIPLGGGFRINGNVLRINASGILFDGDALVKSLTLPFTEARFVRYDDGDMFEIPDGSLQVDDLQLLGVNPVQVNTSASFGYDAVGRQAWVLDISGSGSFQNPVASISTTNLGIFEPNRTIPLAAVRFYSTGLEEVQLYNNSDYAYRVYDIADFSLQNVFLYNESFKFSGNLILGIPAFPAYPTSFGYSVEGNSLAPPVLEGFYMDPIEMNGIVLRFNPDRSTNNQQGTSVNSMTISQGRIEIVGALSDENPEVFRDILYTLVKTNESTRLDIDRNPIQSMPLGGSTTGSRMILSNIEGNMLVQGGQWNHLFIEGDMPEEMGFTADGKRMRFDVMGYLSAKDQEVKLSDIETPFGDIQLVYDLIHHRLSGSLNVSGGVSNGPQYNGSVQMLIDRYGFYFMSGLSVMLPSPKIEGMAFMLIGDYSTRTVEMDALLVQYSMFVRKKLEVQTDPSTSSSIYNQLNANPLAGLNQVASHLGGDFLPVAYINLFGTERFNGFYFGAGASIPLPIIPNFELDMSPVAHFAMGLNGGIDVRFGASFGSQNVYTTGFNVFLDAFFGGGANAGVLCVYGRIGLLVSVGLDGTFYSNGNYEIAGGAEMLLAGKIVAGGGACSLDSNCENVTCVHCTVEATLEFALEGLITQSSSDFRIVSRVGSQPEKSVYEPPPPPDQQ